MDHLTSLLVRARDGDRTALERFVAETQGDVWTMCRYLGDHRDADDLAQEAYERAIGSLHRYRADGPARGWLLTIVRRVCADHARRSVRRRRLEKTVLHESTTGGAVGTAHGVLTTPDGTGRIELDALLAGLDADRRSAFVLTQVLGMHYDEAAEILGCPIGTVRSRVSRARRDLVEMTRPDEARPDRPVDAADGS